MTEKRPREIATQPLETGAAEHDEGAEADECIEEAGKQDEAAEEPSGCAKRVRARPSGFNVGTEGEELVASHGWNSTARSRELKCCWSKSENGVARTPK